MAITVGNGQMISAVGIGAIDLDFDFGSRICITAFCVLGNKQSLLAVSQFNNILPLIFEDRCCISKRNTLQCVSPRSPSTPDVPGTYNISPYSGSAHPASFSLEVKGQGPMRPAALDAALLHPDPFDAPGTATPLILYLQSPTS